MADLAGLVSDIASRLQAATDRGRVADYIPELAKVSPRHFGIAVITADGTEHVAGDAGEAFSIQSVSKVFALVEALSRHGNRVWDRVGKEPSGSAFNSIIQLELEQGRPRNPFINAGAIAVTDLIAEGRSPGEGLQSILALIRRLSGDETIDLDAAVAWSEAATGYRNAALANYMRAFGTIAGPVDATLSVYFQQCAIAMSCRQLARAGRFLMAGGVCPVSGEAIVSPERARRINALMLTCGHYDASGEFAFQVGLPAKSGVGGGILAIAPGRASIAVWSPGLSPQGNSLLGTRALEQLAHTMRWSVFNPDIL
ncbi:glutaminase [Polymorphobacter glacialis]|uniref:Glutaminase n=1 Tax=Sandarakinorhabdus glacialis TaxID=1614636 RepID=A0A916ZKE7_9SPHN|nr:glutaminase [Polymorphobacter glacialis]GGE00844.1 glutaminase [Polymorphobacter glacialis]